MTSTERKRRVLRIGDELKNYLGHHAPLTAGDLVRDFCQTAEQVSDQTEVEIALSWLLNAGKVETNRDLELTVVENHAG